ncbi:FAD:protein FMN transferase [Rhodobiaceae bacterium]|nr:FAD:protein FMN transferase [Rhodobiaceae bacterium]
MKNRAQIAPAGHASTQAPAMSRRRCLVLFASAATLPLPVHGKSTIPHTWNGVALGGDVSVTLDGFTATESARLTDLAVMELHRLEGIFSLHQPLSALSCLNRKGSCAAAPPELIDALAVCGRLHDQSGGVFDPSVQRLWEFYDAQSQQSANNQTTKANFVAAQDSLGFDRVEVSDRQISLPDGMSLTLNGIAQGIVTDHIAELLRDAGARHTLINLGEFRALGPKADGTAWQIGLRDPNAAWRLSNVVQLRGGALATSAGSGHKFREGHHLIDPGTGKSAAYYSSVTVAAPTATLADGLSTALYLLPLPQAQELVGKFDSVAARFTLSDGRFVTTEGWGDLVL